MSRCYQVTGDDPDQNLVLIIRLFSQLILALLSSSVGCIRWVKWCMLGLTLLLMFMSVVDMFVACCWRVALCWWKRPAFTPVWAHSFYTPECRLRLCVSARRVSTHTKPLCERVNNENVRPFINTTMASKIYTFIHIITLTLDRRVTVHTFHSSWEKV